MVKAAKKPTHATDVMVDLETLGTRADSVIMSIGAVRFDPYTDEIDDRAFYASISIESNLDAGRHVDEKTLIWWLGQSPEAQQVFHEGKMALESALTSFADWFHNGSNAKQPIWSNGADFDIPMLSHAFGSLKLDTPWLFWNSRCYRTMKNFRSAVRVATPTRTGHHNALADADYQARHLQAIYKEIKA